MGQGSNCRKSSHSGAQGAQCVETASDAGMILVRDSSDRDGGTLAFGAAAWGRFIRAL
jgi:Domain of unknown function (DUF397)